MRSWARRNWRWATPVAAVLAAVGLWLFFGYFAFHTILIDDEVDEALPFFVAGPAPSGIASDETTEAMAEAMNEAMTELDMPMDDEVAEPMPPEMAGDATPRAENSNAGEAPSGDSGIAETPEPEPAEPETPEPAEPQIIVEASGSFASRSHPTSGSARVLGDGSGQRFLRLEDFRTDNGPDLDIYLSTAPPDAPAGAFDDDFVGLGDLKGNIGSQNYEIPAGLDLDRYSTVVVWCVRFGVVFGAAGLSAG